MYSIVIVAEKRYAVSAGWPSRISRSSVDISRYADAA